jgi:hypothetical protein
VITLAYAQTNLAPGFTARLTGITDPMGRHTAVKVGTAGALDTIWHPDNTVALTAEADTLKRITGYRPLGRHLWTVGYGVTSGTLAAMHAPHVMTTDAGLVRPRKASTAVESWVLAPAGKGTAAVPALRVLPGNVRITSTDAVNNRVTLQVDRFGLAVRTEAPLGSVAVTERDEHGRVIRTASPTGDVIRTVYGAAGTSAVTDSLTGRTLSFAYNSFNQLTEITGGLRTVSNEYEVRDEGAVPGPLAFSRTGSEARSYQYGYPLEVC